MSEVFSFVMPSFVISCLIEIVITVCAREEVEFICVAATVRDAVPASIALVIVANESTALALVPSTNVPLGVVRTLRSSGLG